MSAITFNRRLRVSWLVEGLRLAAQGVEDTQAEATLQALVGAENPGHDTITKSVRYIRHLWFADDDEFATLRQSALTLYREIPQTARANVLCWGMVLARYPFVRQVSEIVGRLLRLQGDVKQEQLKRKIKENFGERETAVRSGRYVVSLLSDFGFIRLDRKSGRYEPGSRLKVDDPAVAAWFLQAFMASAARREMPKDEVTNAPSLFMMLPDTLLNLALRTPRFRLGRESLSHELVSLL